MLIGVRFRLCCVQIGASKAKQADTIMLGYPLGVDMPAAVRKHDLDYYANHTGGGPSMTWSMYGNFDMWLALFARIRNVICST